MIAFFTILLCVTVIIDIIFWIGEPQDIVIYSIYQFFKNMRNKNIDKQFNERFKIKNDTWYELTNPAKEERASLVMSMFIHSKPEIKQYYEGFNLSSNNALVFNAFISSISRDKYQEVTDCSTLKLLTCLIKKEREKEFEELEKRRKELEEQNERIKKAIKDMRCSL